VADADDDDPDRAMDEHLAIVALRDTVATALNGWQVLDPDTFLEPIFEHEISRYDFIEGRL
jgi:hypothetical protein